MRENPVWMGPSPVAIETEAKLKVESHGEVRARLEEAGATRVGRVLETNAIFDDAGRTFLVADKGLRVRRVDAIDGPPPQATLTYKGPKRAGDLKSREEVELTVSDAEAARAFLTALGFLETLTFQKRRETWVLGDCHVEMDELPHLGCYVEIEGPDAEAVGKVLARLELADLPILKDSYIGLLVDHCRRHDLATDRIEFATD